MYYKYKIREFVCVQKEKQLGVYYPAKRNKFYGDCKNNKKKSMNMEIATYLEVVEFIVTHG